MRTSDFERTSPSRLFQRAANYTKHLGHYHDLPKNISKSMMVRQQAESQKDQIDFSIKRSQYQLELYRKKENDDMMRRTTFERKLNESAEKVAKNEKDIEAKKAKVAKEYEKHLRKTYRKYEDDEKKHRENEREQAYKLRKELKEFYQKEAARKKSAEFKQISVGTCYQSAVEKINNIHRRNEQYSLKAEELLNKELQKNNHFEEIIKKKRRSVSSMNEAKSKIYEQNLTIFEQREKSFIQKYGRNQDGSISAFRHIQSEEEKEKKRLKEFFKKRVEKWAHEKKRVDQAKAEISQKCTSILQRTSNSFFRQTVSSFRSTSKEWQKLVQRNKSAIKSSDQMKKDQIMDQHLDLRLRNTSSFKVSERMRSMKLQAKKLASDYL